MATLAIDVDGLKFKNPFVIGSGPPSTNSKIMNKAFAAGWGGVVAKTTSLTDTPVVNVQPRYGHLKTPSKDKYAFENIELISDAPFEDWERWFQETKSAHPEGVLIGSIMESYEKGRWQELAARSVAAGCDALELNFSCPHGHPETGMGAAMGQDPAQVQEVTSWVVAAVDVPVWAKMTPNITDITQPAIAARAGGAHGISAINTILSCIGIHKKKLRPLPMVQGQSTFGGYSYRAVKPIALRMVAQIAQALPGVSLSGIGGVVTSWDAAEHIMMGANTVQSCTGPMLHGFEMVTELQEGLLAVMEEHGFDTIEAMRGHCLQYLTTHHHLVELQAEARARREEARRFRDQEWGEKDIQAGTESLTSE